MQIVAMLTMLIDHIGHIFFPDVLWWRVIGRIAFPIYCYCIVRGYFLTSDLNRYFMRLFALGLLSQIPFMLALDVQGINVIGTLFISLAVLYALDQLKSMPLKVVIVLAAAALLDALPFDYGSYGLLLVLIYRYAEGHLVVLLHFLLNLTFLMYKDWVLQMPSVAATALIVYAPVLFRLTDRIQVPRWVWRAFYPAHFVALFLAAQLLLRS